MKILKFKNITIFILLLISFSAHSVTDQSTIKVTGVANIVVESNQGKISANVRSSALSADEAINQNSIIMQHIIQELNSVDINGTDIQTSGFSFSPQYDWQNNQREFIGYSVSNNLSITVGDTNTVGVIVDLLVEAGVTRINSVSFTSVNMQTLRAQVMISATADALNKATILAKASHVGLGAAVSIISSSTNGSITPNEGLGIAPSTTDSVIIPGTNSIYASVTIEYLID